MQAMIDRDWLKIIRDPRQDSVELYDLKKDPEELTNLADDQARVEKALGRLTRFFETHRLRREGYVAPLVR
jgi:arylsulfatase A-like enzyme